MDQWSSKFSESFSLDRYWSIECSFLRKTTKRTKICSSLTNPKIPGKEGKNAHKSTECPHRTPGGELGEVLSIDDPRANATRRIFEGFFSKSRKPWSANCELRGLRWHVCRVNFERKIFFEPRISLRKMLRNFPRNVWAFVLWVRKNPRKIPSKFPTKFSKFPCEKSKENSPTSFCRSAGRWEGGGEGAVERGVKSSLKRRMNRELEAKKAHNPWIREGLHREVQTVLSASKIPVFQFTVCTSWFARPWFFYKNNFERQKIISEN